MSTIFSRSSIVLVLLVAVVPARADDTGTPPPPPPLNVMVSGSSAEPIARAIAAELDRQVSIIADDAACPAPCAAIAVDTSHDAATVRVTSDGGELRQRTISIPRDPAGAADVIALLVGNMAREEATAIIDDLDAGASEDVTAGDGAATGEGEAVGEGAATGDGEAVGEGEATGPVETPDQVEGAPELVDPIEGAPVLAGGVAVGPGVAVAIDSAAGPEREGRTSLSIGLVPPLAIRFGGASHRGMSIQAIVGWASESHVLSLAGAVDYVSDDVYGLQIAGAVAVGGRVHGVQIAGAAALADRADGLQIAGAVTHSGGRAAVQIAGAVNDAGGRVGTQVAGAVNESSGGAGVQVAGAVNHAGGSVGTQVAGAVNIAGDHVYGAQIGVVNVAGTVDGLQLGIVNIASKENGGLSLGLINIVPGGRSDLEAYVDTDQVGAVMFRHGSSHWHNIYGVAGRATGGLLDSELTDDDVFMYGFGFGPTFKLGKVTLDTDLVGWHVLYGDGTHGHADVLAQLRLCAAFPLGGIELIGGVAANAYITTDPARDGFAAKRVDPGPAMDTGVRVMLTPSAFVGVRL